VGAGLLAKALYQSPDAFTDTPLSRASPLPQLTELFALTPYDWKSTMKKTLLSHPVKALALALGLFSSAVFAADAPLKVGTTAAFAIPLEAAVEEAGKQGLKVELVEFTDWIAPNVSLAAGDIDVNYLQHIPFL
jgi:D-methionine transport system substrate-binding protein